jgi:competence protein ComEC
MSIFILFFSISLSPYPFAFIVAEDKVESNSLDSLTVKFMNIGSGDCILIKQGNTEIMIDAGDVSETNKNNDLDKPSDIVNEIKQLCSDGKLEYLIVTHGDADHIVNIPTVLDEIEGYIEK